MTPEAATFHPPLPLGRRISLVVVVIAVILALALQAVGLLVTREHLEQAYRQHAEATVSLVAPQVEEIMLTGSTYRLPPLLRNVSHVHAFLRYVVVALPDGTVLAYECAGGLPGGLAEFVKARSERGQQGMVLLNVRAEHEDILHLVKPLEHGRVGYLHLGFSWSPVDAALRQSCLNLLAAMIAGLLISALVAWVVYRRLMRPVVQLVNAARQFGAGRLDQRVQERPGAHDEAELLAQAFNQMASHLEQHVNELERSRAELTGEKLRVQAILDSMVEPVIVAANDSKIIYSNSAARSLWLPQGAPAPEQYAEFHKGLTDVLKAFDAVASGRVAREQLRRRFRDRDLVVLIAPALGRNGEQLGVIEITADVTEQIEAERAMAHAEKLNVVGQLAAGVAHEINSPLDGAIEASRIIERSAGDPDKVVRFARAQRDALERIGAIVRTLLTFSRRPRIQERRPVAVSKLLEEAETILKHRLIKQKAALALSGPPHGQLLVDGDELGLVQVLVNLINNAADVTPEGGTIQIAVRATAEQIEISVTDQGPGIPPEVAPRLFTPFFTTKAVGQGTGLGLATSRNIVEEHGGRIQFVNLARPWGARFTVCLPQRCAQAGSGVAPRLQPVADLGGT
ncbi:MAG: ATP-binding protein [Planctomycetota bacterium]